jgi:hypothetical protein
MSRNRSSVVFLGFAAIATVACPLAAGCMGAESDELGAQGSFDVPLTAMTGGGDPDDPPVSHNPLYPICFWNHGTQQTYRDLAQGALANAQGQLPSMPYLAQGLSLFNQITCKEQSLRYLILCALPQGTSVTNPVNNATFHGHFGIAPEWRTGPLSATNKEWITSCLLQHLNGYNTSTALLLEANRSGFLIGTVPLGYSWFDSITWGNLFISTTPLDPAGWTWNSAPAFRPQVCYFGDLQQECNSAEEAIETKLCSADYNSCGVDIVGRCETECSWNTPNRVYSPTAYWTCGGKTTSFRERLPSPDMYGLDCNPPE